MPVIPSIGPQSLARTAGAINVAAYGALGDGITDDTLAIRDAITAAGVNGTVLFPPGKTFVLSGAIEPLAGQTIIGYGAILKRCAAISTTTSSSITTSGTQAITVADASAFRVGMDVTAYTGSSPNWTFDPHNHRILSIAGNVITVGTLFTQGFASGATLITAFDQISAQGVNDIAILGIECDGNKSNNSAFFTWQNHTEIHLYGDRTTVRDCYLHDCAKEGLEGGGANSVWDNNVVRDCNGNGMHLSSSSGAKVIHNYVKNCNLSVQTGGHDDGCIIASNTVGDTYVAGNYCEGGIAGIGSWDTDDDSSLICTGNTIRGCTGAAFEGTLPAANKTGKIVFADNLIYASGKIALDCANTTLLTTQGAYRAIVANNYLEDTTITVSNSGNDIQIRGNTIVNAGTTALLIYAARSANVAIQANTLIGGGYGIYIDGTTTRDVLITDNSVKNQQTTGIRFNAAPAGNCMVSNNLVVQESSQTPSSSYAGIVPANGVTVINNTIDIGTNTTGQYGILCPNGGVGVPGAVVANNIVRSGTNVPSIRTAGGSQNNIIVNNFTVQAVSNAGGASNTVSGNTTIL